MALHPILWLAVSVAVLNVLTAAECPDGCTGCDGTALECDGTADLHNLTSPDNITQLVTTCHNASLKMDYFEEITQLFVNLKHLSIHQCDMGNLTVVYMGNDTGITSLNLSDNGISSIDQDFLDIFQSLSTLDLSYNSLKSFQLRANPNLSTVILRNNALDTLDLVHFAGSASLDHLDLSGNAIESITPLTNATLSIGDLDLSDNNLSNVPESAFANAQIYRLSLAWNNINTLQSGTFLIQNLTEIDLSNNRLRGLNFQLPSSLRYLDLRSNSIQVVPFSFIQSLPKGINVILLHGNKLKCTCKEAAFIHFLQENETMFEFKGSFPSCAFPLPQSILEVAATACEAPTVTVTQKDNRLVCDVTGNPPAWITWFDDVISPVASTYPPMNVSVHLPNLTLRVNPNTKGQFRCMAWNEYGNSSVTVFFASEFVEKGGFVNPFKDISLKMYIGSLVGVFIATMLMVLYVYVCCRFCRCPGCEKEKMPRKSLRGYSDSRRAQPYMDHIRPPEPPKPEFKAETPPSSPPDIPLHAHQRQSIPVEPMFTSLSDPYLPDSYRGSPPFVVDMQGFNMSGSSSPRLTDLTEEPDIRASHVSTFEIRKRSTDPPNEPIPNGPSSDQVSSNSHDSRRVAESHTSSVPELSLSGSYDSNVFANNRRVSDRFKLRPSSKTLADLVPEASNNFEVFRMLNEEAEGLGQEMEV